ncbi:MAG: TylF/MycF family methyltransferase [Acidobacteriaceae bacterium]|nr:TylF/MycF family methyltransferase [Acidobacteriaceae bacterium]
MQQLAPDDISVELSTPAAARLYLRLLKRCLCRDLFPDARYDGVLPEMGRLPFERALRQDGKDWPTEAETMVGMKRLDNLQHCCLSAIYNHVPGDFVETGVWRGGCSILMRATLAAAGDQVRNTWLFDSFEGLPKPDPNSFPKDEGDSLWAFSSYLGVSLDQVKANFERYELLDERTQFVRGWFRDTIPNAGVDKISVLRLDGDMYESTWLVLTSLYPKISPGGFVIVDDYGAIPACQSAVDDFRQKHSIRSPMTQVDWTGVFWQVQS